MEGISGGGGGVARVKQEPEWDTDITDRVTVKEEAEFVYEEARVKECSDSTDGCGVSEAAMLAGLYDDHEVKDELVLGPERPHRPTVGLVVRAPAVVCGRRRSCSVRLERLLVDAERRTCRVGRRTYKLHATEPPTPHVTTTVYQCHHCGKRCSTKTTLRYHLMMHTGEKPHKCPYCNYRSARSGHLRSHEMIHEGNKPFKCNYCDYKCNRKDHLQFHEMIHTGENPFKCKYCDYKCKRKKVLRTHEMIHTGENPFNCSNCNYKCKSKSSLRRHQLVHSGEYPFQCSYCEYKCRQKTYLKKHMNLHTS